ncbi:Mu transposase C-terminal domain-containing protein [Hydrogenophaga sp.]|uniref:Mu transposase C-terminal domain-containing protein n=1 Tax=Hydrogenophaga sp. TaxID=1904254 RepID=UPI003AF7B799
MKELDFGDQLYDPRVARLVMQVTSSELAMGRVRVLEANADVERWIPYDELRCQIGAGTLEVRRKDNPTLAVFLDHDDATTCKRRGSRYLPSKESEDRYLAAVHRATKVVNAMNDYCKRHKVSAYAAYDAVREQFISSSTGFEFPSVASVYRMIERDRCKASLITPNKKRGNHDGRHSKAMDAFICRLAKKTYLTEKSKWTLKEFTDACRRMAIARGIAKPASRLSKKYVHKIITTKLHSMPKAARLLKKDRAAQMSVASHRIQVEGILQRVEQDTVHLPFVIMTEDGPCSDVYLIQAIDCASSNVVGWHLQIGAPNESSGLECVESTLFSKATSFSYFGIDESHDLYGTCGLLVLDNGPEGRGGRFRRLGQLGIDVHYCKARHPQEKPFIERLNRSLKEALQLLPGCTRVDGKDGQRNPVVLGDKLMELKELERWIVHWYFNDWADTVLERFVDEEVSENRGLGVTPRQRFKNIVERVGCPLPLPPNRSDWIRTKYNVVSRKLNIKSGVTFEGYDFKGDNLMRLLHRFGQEPVLVLYDPEDYRRVYVLEDEALVELTNQSATEFSPAYSFEYAKEHRAQLKKKNSETAKQAAFRTASQEKSLEEHTQKGQPKKSSGRDDKKQVVQRAKQRDAVNRAVVNLRISANVTGHFGAS